MQCIACGATVPAEGTKGDYLCDCGALLPPDRKADHFGRLGVPPTARLAEGDLGVLEQRYKERSRKLHPDKFARANPVSRRFSLEHTTLLNEAYRTLRDPIKRATYLLALRGVKVSEKPGEGGATASPALLMDMMELGEALTEAGEHGEKGGEAVEQIFADVEARRDRALERLIAEAEQKNDASALEALVELRYLERFLEGRRRPGDGSVDGQEMEKESMHHG